MARTADQDEIVLDLIEDLMVLGVERIGKIRHEVNNALATMAPPIPRIGDKRTCANMMERVRARWRRRDGSTEAERERLLAEAVEGMRQAYDVARTTDKPRTKISALRTVELFQRRRAKLQGLDTIKLDIGLSQEQLDDLRKRRLEEALAGRDADPLLAIYLSVPPDSGQGNGPLDPAAAERPAAADSPG